MTNISEHLTGPWRAVLHDTDGFVWPSVDEAIEDHGDDEEVTVAVVRGSALPNDRDGTTGVLLRMPGHRLSGDVAHEVDCYLVDPDDESTGAAARFAQAQAMAAGLNAAAEQQAKAAAR